MRKFSRLIVLLASFLSGISGPSFAAEGELHPFKKETLSIETAGNKKLPFNVEIANEELQRQEGLKHRTELANDAGMLFVFDEDSYVQMWMKDTPISLDMLFLDNQGKIIFIAPRTKPESTDIISAKREARAVLELAAGVTDKLGIKTGDRVIYSAFK